MQKLEPPQPQLVMHLVDCIRKADQPQTTTLVVELENRGVSTAHNVKTSITVSPFSDYTLESWDDPMRQVGRLSPGDKQKIDFTVLLKNVRDPFINAEFEVSYSDHGSEKNCPFKLRVPITGKDETAQFQNPYVPGGPLDPRHSEPMFFGRRELIQSIIDNMFGKYQKNILVLHGERRVGKTSILLQLRHQHLKPPLYPVFIDLQAFADVGTYLFLRRLAKIITESLEEFGKHIASPTRQEILDGGYARFDDFLNQIGILLDHDHLVIMFDEFEELEKRVQNRKIDRDLLYFLRSQIQHRHWLVFIFAGTHRLEELSKEYFSIFFNAALYHEISFLTESEAEALIRQPVAKVVSYEDRAVKRILNATSGHPYFIQLICYYLINRLNREGRNQVNFLDVDGVIDMIMQGDVGHLDYLWTQSSPKEQLVLCGIAELQRNLPRVKRFPDIEILREIQNIGGKLSRFEFDSALELLIARKIVRHDSKSRSCGITFELLSRWIREKHPRISK